MACQGQRGWNPAGLGAAIAINGAVLALLTTMATTTIRHSDPWKPMEAVNIPIVPPPLPPDTPPKPAERAVTDPAPVPLPYIPPAPRPVPGPVIESVDILPPAPVPSSVTATTGGTGTGTAGVSVATPLPVLVAASVDPRYRADFQPDYPAFERNLARDGLVVVRVLVGSNGRIAAVERVSATSDAFFEATKRRALSRWRFRPATRDGVAVESWREMTVRFAMADG